MDEPAPAGDAYTLLCAILDENILSIAEFAPLPPFYTVQSRPGNPHAPFALASDPSSSPPSLNLGVPLALVKPIYTIARTRFWEARRALEEQIVAIADREGEARHGHALENAPSTCPVCELGEDATASLASSSLLLLLVHAEDPTPWNVRRRIFLHSFHCSLPGPPSKHDVDLHTRTIRTASAHQELAASALVLSRHPGSSAAWSYRRWLLTTITTTQNLHLPTFTPSALLPTELRLTLRAAEKKHSNYLAWGHRGWALQWAVGGCDVGGGGARDDAVLLSDISHHSTSFLPLHPSDVSAFHHVVRVLHLLRTGTGTATSPSPSPSTSTSTSTPSTAIRAAAEEHLEFAKTLARRYPTHEAAWMHVRGVAHACFLYSPVQPHTAQSDKRDAALNPHPPTTPPPDPLAATAQWCVSTYQALLDPGTAPTLDSPDPARWGSDPAQWYAWSCGVWCGASLAWRESGPGRGSDVLNLMVAHYDNSRSDRRWRYMKDILAADVVT